MKITKDKFVSLSYTLTVDGNVVEKVEASKPLEFVFGSGTLLPQFEANIDGKETGDKFTFSLTPEEAYGNIMEEAVVELPKHLFMIDGKVNEDLLKVGNMLTAPAPTQAPSYSGGSAGGTGAPGISTE